MSTSRRNFVGSLFGVGSALTLLHTSGSEAEGGFLCNVRSKLRSWRCSTETPPVDSESGFRDYPGRVFRIPDEKGLHEIAPIPAGENRAYSLHIGVNWTSPNAYYKRSTNNLNACVRDATDLRRIMQEYKFNSSILTNEYATTTNVRKDIARAAAELNAGDLFVVTYSGHGASVDDSNGDEKVDNDPDVLGDRYVAKDNSDETLCLHDRMLIDDELHVEWKKFKAGVRIVVILDSCHSGTAIKSIKSAGLRVDDYRKESGFTGDITLDGAASEIAAFILGGTTGATRSIRSSGLRLAPPAMEARERQRIRTFPQEYNLDLMLSNRVENRQLEAKAKAESAKLPPTIQATVLLLAACQDAQVAREEGLNGLFTRAIQVVLADPTAPPGTRALFNGNYEKFFAQVKDNVGVPSQTPNFYAIGTSNPTFLSADKPFAV